jgi:dihydroorotate dehydrogenase (NAD+) catalytic subunit
MSCDIGRIAFAHPILAASGPQTGDARGVRRAVAGGAAGVVMQTVSTRAARTPRPFMTTCRDGGMLSSCLWSETALEQYLTGEYGAAAAAEAPVLASIGFTADELIEIGPKIEATGTVSGLEFPLHYTGLGYEPVIATARALRGAVRLPLFAKLSPGIPEIGALARAIEPFVDAFTVGGAVASGLQLKEDEHDASLGSKLGAGWLSGKPIMPLALRCVFDVSRQVSAPVIGCGGISTGRDVIAFLRAGASAVQVGTAAILEGPGVFARIREEMEQWLYAHEYAAAADVRNKYLDAAKRGRRLDTEGAAPRVYDERCVRCGRCVTACYRQALSLEFHDDRQDLIVADNRCVRCGLCISVCPHKALHV